MDERTLRIVLEAIDRSKGVFDAMRRNIGDLRRAMADLNRGGLQFGGLGRGASGFASSIFGILNPLNLARGALHLLGSIGSAVFGLLRSLIGGVFSAVAALARAIGSTLVSALQSMASAAVTAAKVAVLGLAGAMGMLAKQGISVNLSLQGTERGLAVMLKSAPAAKALVDQMRVFAESSVYQFTEISGWGKQLIAMGFSAGEIIPTIRILGDAIAGLGGGSEKMGRVMLALGQMRAKGTLSGEEIMQLTEAGIGARGYLQKAGLLKPGQDIARAKIEAQTGINAILAGMQETFGGMQAGAMATLPGIWSNIKDAIDRLSASITTGLLGSLTRAAKATLDFVSNLDKTRDGQRLLGMLRQVFESVGRAVERLAARLPELLHRLVAFLGGERFEKFKTFAQNAFEMLVKAASTTLTWISAHWEPIWNTVRNTAVGALKIIIGTISGLMAMYRQWSAAHPTIGDKLKSLADAMIQFGIAGLNALKPLAVQTARWLGLLISVVAAIAGAAVGMSALGITAVLPAIFGGTLGALVGTLAGGAIADQLVKGVAGAFDQGVGALKNIDTSRIGEGLKNVVPALKPGSTFREGYAEGAAAVDDTLRSLSEPKPKPKPPEKPEPPEKPLTPGWKDLMRQVPAPPQYQAGELVPVPSRGTAQEHRSFEERGRTGSTITPPPEIPQPGFPMDPTPPQHAARAGGMQTAGLGGRASYADTRTAEVAQVAAEHLRAAADALAKLPEAMRRGVTDEVWRLAEAVA